MKNRKQPDFQFDFEKQEEPTCFQSFLNLFKPKKQKTLDELLGLPPEPEEMEIQLNDCDENGVEMMPQSNSAYKAM